MDRKPDPEGPLGPTVVFDPVVPLPVLTGLVGKMPLPVGYAVGPPVESVRGERVSVWLAHRGPINPGKATELYQQIRHGKFQHLARLGCVSHFRNNFADGRREVIKCGNVQARLCRFLDK